MNLPRIQGWADPNPALLLTIRLLTSCVCFCQGLDENLCSKPGIINELPTCNSTRGSFWSAEPKWILKMKVTSGLFWNAVVHEIRLWASLRISSRYPNLAQTTCVTQSDRNSSFVHSSLEHLRASFSSWLLTKAINNIWNVNPGFSFQRLYFLCDLGHVPYV